MWQMISGDSKLSKMNKYLLLACFLFLLSAPAEAKPNSLRKCFHESVLDESKVEMFHQKVMNITSPTATEQAYQAASFALLARKTWNPLEKIGYINRYGKLIDRAIREAPNDIEIRFLRLSIDHNTPSIIGRQKNIKNDKDQILFLLRPIVKFDLDSHFNKFILYFLRTENIYSKAELDEVVSKLN